MTTPPPPEPPEPKPGPAPEPEPETTAQPTQSSPASDPQAAPPLPNAGGPYPDDNPRYPPPPPLSPESYPGHPGASGYDYGPYGAPPARQNNGMGVAALVMGIVGFLIGPCSILAIVFGRIGLNRVARGEAGNRGMAQAGFVLGIVGLVLWILGMIALASR